MSKFMDPDYLCPVCKKHHFEYLGDDEMCPVCGWWNDTVQALDHDYEGGENDMSVNQYREAWLKGLPKS